MSAQAGAGAVGGAMAFMRTQPFYWAVRRELWEYRSIYVAPLAIGAVIVVSSAIPLFRLPHAMRSAMALDPAQQREALVQHYDIAAALIMGAAFLVSIYYALDALYGERRDRSILFWKSLPVSDLTTVLAKASIPLVVIPAVAFAATVVTELMMLLMSSAMLLANGLSVTWYWSLLRPFSAMFLLAYHLVTVHFLWYAPNYAFLLLISAWAKRAPVLWAALPLFAITIFEKMAFHTSYLLDYLEYRVGAGGREGMSTAQNGLPMDPAMHITPGVFLATPGLWFGLMMAAVFLFAAARLRRYRQPN